MKEDYGGYVETEAGATDIDIILSERLLKVLNKLKEKTKKDSGL